MQTRLCRVPGSAGRPALDPSPPQPLTHRQPLHHIRSREQEGRSHVFLHAAAAEVPAQAGVRRLRRVQHLCGDAQLKRVKGKVLEAHLLVELAVHDGVPHDGGGGRRDHVHLQRVREGRRGSAHPRLGASLPAGRPRQRAARPPHLVCRRPVLGKGIRVSEHNGGDENFCTGRWGGERASVTRSGPGSAAAALPPAAHRRSTPRPCPSRCRGRRRAGCRCGPAPCFAARSRRPTNRSRSGTPAGKEEGRPVTGAAAEAAFYSAAPAASVGAACSPPAARPPTHHVDPLVPIVLVVHLWRAGQQRAVEEGGAVTQRYRVAALPAWRMRCPPQSGGPGTC